MIRILVSRFLNYFRNSLRSVQTARYVVKISRMRRLQGPTNFDLSQLRVAVQEFVDGLRADESGCHYRYAASCRVATLYASAYACMTYSLLGVLVKLGTAQKKRWLEYFDSFQSQADGLFYDSATTNEIFPDTDWWGARHLALHMINAYTDLGERPRYPFKFLSPYYDVDVIRGWLDAQEWDTNTIGLGDLDNRIMNIGCLLQFQRDQWVDAAAGDAVEYLKGYLLQKINPATGLWGGFNVDDPGQRSRMVQFAYHLFPLYFYDGFFGFDHERIVELVLRTQNPLGGFGVAPNSSACEDIESIDILIRLAPRVSEQRGKEIEIALVKAWQWVLCNQGADGGFVFRLFEPFAYGHEATSSAKNEGAMLPTWFRTLSLVYLSRHFSASHSMLITRCPGYEF